MSKRFDQNLLDLIKSSLNLCLANDSLSCLTSERSADLIKEIYLLILQNVFWFYSPAVNLLSPQIINFRDYILNNAADQDQYYLSHFDLGDTMDFDHKLLINTFNDLIGNSLNRQLLMGILIPDNLVRLKAITDSNKLFCLILKGINKLQLSLNQNNQPFTKHLFYQLSIQYEMILNLRMEMVNSKLNLVYTNPLRKKMGAFYTPELMLDGLTKNITKLSFQSFSIDNMRIFDPCCGNGQILLNLAKNFKEQGKLFRKDLYYQFMLKSIFGADINEIATQLCKLNFWLELDDLTYPINFLNNNILNLDSLTLHNIPLRFNLIVSNPPYGNAIEKKTGRNKFEYVLYKEKFPQITNGPYDKANLFVFQSVKNLLMDNGYYAFVLPKAFLSTKSAYKLQDYLNRYAPPAMIIIPQNNHIFNNATIFTTIIQGQKVIPSELHELTIVKDFNLNNSITKKIKLLTPWWQFCFNESFNIHNLDDCYRLSDLASIKAGLSTKAAYELLPKIIDDNYACGLKLLTTGSIDININYWGIKTTRFLGRKFLFPKAPDLATLSPSALLNSLEYQLQPKIILAGLTKRIEAFFDEFSQYAGLVQTFLITSKQLDLSLILAILHSPAYSYYYLKYFGGKEIGGGNYFTIGKQELMASLIPKTLLNDPDLVDLIRENTWLNDSMPANLAKPELRLNPLNSEILKPLTPALDSNKQKPILDDLINTKIGLHFKVNDFSGLNNWYHN